MATAPAFLFDLDGTLADTLADIAESANEVRRRHDLPPVGEDVVRAWVGDGARALLRRALAEVLRNEAETAVEARLDAAFAEYAEHHAGQCTRLVRPYPGVREHLEELAAAGHPLAVVTNKPARFAVPIVEHLGLAGLLPVVVGGDSAPARKPDPAPLRFALERLGAAPAGAVMVGDGIQDLRAGRALGLRTIACLFGFTAEDRLRREGADVYWSRFGGS